MTSAWEGSERNAGADKAVREIAQGASVTFLVTIIGYLCIFVFKLLAARYFGASDYGLFEMLNTLFGIFALVAALGISPGIAPYFVTYKLTDRPLLKGYLHFILLAPVAMAVAVTIMVWLAADSIAALFAFGPGFAELIRFASVFLPVRVLNETISYVLQAEKNMLTGSIGYNVIERLVLIAGMYIIIRNNLSLYHLVWAFGLSLLVSLLFHLYFARHLLDFLRERIKQTYRPVEWLTFSFPLLLSGVFYFIMSWTDNFVIAASLTPADLGVYGVTYSSASYLLFIPPMFFSIFMPVITEMIGRDKAQIRFIVAQVRNWWFISAAFFGAIFIALPQQILTVLYGPDFAAGAHSLRILSAFFLISVYLSSYNALLIIHKRTKTILFANIGCSLLNLLLAVLFVRTTHSITAVALASGISLILLRLIECWKSRDFVSVPWDASTTLKTVVISFASVALTTVAHRVAIAPSVASPLFAFGLSIALYAALFAALAATLRLFHKQDAIIVDIIEERLPVKLGLVRRLFFR